MHECAETQWLKNTDLGSSSLVLRVVISLTASQSAALTVASELQWGQCGRKERERERGGKINVFEFLTVRNTCVTVVD